MSNIEKLSSTLKVVGNMELITLFKYQYSFIEINISLGQYDFIDLHAGDQLPIMR